MAGVAQRNKFQGLASLLGTRKTRFQQARRQQKTVDCRRIRLQTNCRRFGLEGSQAHIKLLHIASAALGAQRKIPRKQLVPRGFEILAQPNSAVDCLHYYSAEVRAVAAVQRVRFILPVLPLLLYFCQAFLFPDFLASLPLVVPASAAFAALPRRHWRRHIH